MKKFSEMNTYELIEEIEVAETIKANSKKDSDRYIRACLKIDAINEDIERRSGE